jgi:hypothetical protein
MMSAALTGTRSTRATSTPAATSARTTSAAPSCPFGTTIEYSRQSPSWPARTVADATTPIAASRSSAGSAPAPSHARSVSRATSALSSAGCPTASSRPRSSTPIRSQSSSASSVECVASTTVPFVCSRRSRARKRRNWRADTGSRLRVGSSSSSTRGEPRRARAMSSRWRIPEENSPTIFSPVSVSSTCSSTSAIRASRSPPRSPSSAAK